jgi:hypothetical protein
MGQETPIFFRQSKGLLLPAAAPTGEKSRHPIEVQFEVEFVVKLMGDIVEGWLR